MPVGSPDFGQNVSTNPTSPSYDSGEDTTRLLMGFGAQARSGRWIYASGFEEAGINQIRVGSTGGGAGTVAQDTTICYQGDKCLKLNSGLVLNSSVFFQKFFMAPGSRFGIEFLWCKYDTFTVSCEMQIQLIASGVGENKDKQRLGIIVFDIVNAGTNVKVYTENNGVRTLIRDISVHVTDQPFLWHYTKFVFDFETNQYIRLYFDNLVLDLGGVPGYQSPGTIQTGSISAAIVNKYRSAFAVNYAGIGIDNLVITADEP